jgi:hypothetical protein
MSALFARKAKGSTVHRSKDIIPSRQCLSCHNRSRTMAVTSLRPLIKKIYRTGVLSLFSDLKVIISDHWAYLTHAALLLQQQHTQQPLRYRKAHGHAATFQARLKIDRSNGEIITCVIFTNSGAQANTSDILWRTEGFLNRWLRRNFIFTDSSLAPQQLSVA